MPFMSICCLKESRQWPSMEEKVQGFMLKGYSVLHQKPFTSNNLSCKWSFRLLMTQLLELTTRCHPAHRCYPFLIAAHLCHIPDYSFCICTQRSCVFVDCLSDQEERTKAIEAFKEGKKDVLVATDVASKGLDFPAIQHVVNYDMPEEIENYGKIEHKC